MNILVWLRKRLRSRRAPVRRPVLRTRLGFETLEDRVIPSVTSVDPAYLAWRATTFRIDDATVMPVANAASSVSAQSAAPTNSNYGSLIGLNQELANTSYRGTGYSVAIIDTGINYNDPNLGGGYGKRVVGGYNFANNTTDPMDDNGHGTFVASEIASSSSTLSGLAPNVNLIALKVLDSTGSGTYGNVQNALDWVVAHAAQYHIVAINLSLGSGNYTVNPYTFLESDFATLTSEGIFIGVAAGNDYYTDGSTPGLAFPAISPNVVSVGAVWDGNFGAVSWASGAKDLTTSADKIASFSQRSSALSILAPGAVLTGDALNGGTTQMAGTSMATPVIVGAAVILHEALDFASLGANAKQAYILSLMQSTGQAVVDASNGTDNVGHTGLTFKRINLAAAVAAIAPAPPGPAIAIGAVADQTVTSGHAISVTVPTSDASGLPVTLSAQTFSTAQDAYTLVAQYKLIYTGNYWTNLHGMHEKWLWSYAMGGLVACILPDGAIRRYSAAGTAAMLSDANLLGRVDPLYYANPQVMIGIAAPSSLAPPATVFISGTQVTVTPNTQFIGRIYVVVTASDGKTTVQKPFVVNAAAPAPLSIGPISNQSIAAGQSATITVVTSDPNGAAVSWQAQVITAAQDAAAVELQYQLLWTGNYWSNLHGMNEKWLWSKTMGGLVACILPDGSIRRYDPAGTSAMLSDADLLARVAPAYYANPLLLTGLPMTASAGAASTVAGSAVSLASLSITGSQLTVTPTPSFSGNLFVVITASNGSQTAKKYVMFTVQ
jgi:hypothetical protein